MPLRTDTSILDAGWVSWADATRVTPAPANATAATIATTLKSFFMGILLADLLRFLSGAPRAQRRTQYSRLVPAGRSAALDRAGPFATSLTREVVRRVAIVERGAWVYE